MYQSFLNLKHVTSRTVPIQENRLPTPDEAVAIYQQTYHGHITEPSVYGIDLLGDKKLTTAGTIHQFY